MITEEDERFTIVLEMKVLPSIARKILTFEKTSFPDDHIAVTAMPTPAIVEKTLALLRKVAEDFAVGDDWRKDLAVITVAKPGASISHPILDTADQGNAH